MSSPALLYASLLGRFRTMGGLIYIMTGRAESSLDPFHRHCSCCTMIVVVDPMDPQRLLAWSLALPSPSQSFPWTMAALSVWACCLVSILAISWLPGSIFPLALPRLSIGDPMMQKTKDRVMNISSRIQSHSNPMMHKPKGRIVGIVGPKSITRTFTRNLKPKSFMITLIQGTIHI